MKKTVTYIVLFAFSFLLIPTSFWHDCSELHPSHKNDIPGETHFEKGDCFVCDFEIFPIENHSFTKIHFKKQVTVKPTLRLVFIDFNPFIKTNSRGSPLS